MTDPTPAASGRPQPDVNPLMEQYAAAAPTELATAFNANGLGALATSMGIELETAAADLVVARMPVAGNTQPYGILHGGATVVLAETIGSIAAAIHAGPSRIAVGIEVGATHHRSASSGYVIATATPVHRGNTLASYLIEVNDESGRRIATCRLTCMLRSLGGE